MSIKSSCRACAEDAVELRKQLKDQGVDQATINKLVAICKCRTCATKGKPA